MALRRSWLVQGTGDPSGAANASDARLAQAGVYARDSSGLVRAGVLGNPTGLVDSRSDMALDIDAFEAVLTRGTAYGAVPVANDALATVTLPAAPSSNSRIVRVGVIHRDNVDGADATSVPEFVVVAGTAAPSPTAPSLPVGAMPLARVTQPANVLGTADCTVVEEFPMTAAAGGVVPVRTQTEMNAWTPDDGATVYRLDTGFFYERVSGAWLKRSRSYTWGTIFGANSDSTGIMRISHGLGVVPDWVGVVLRNTSDDVLNKVADALVWGTPTSTYVDVRFRRNDTAAYFGVNAFAGYLSVGKN